MPFTVCEECIQRRAVASLKLSVRCAHCAPKWSAESGAQVAARAPRMVFDSRERFLHKIPPAAGRRSVSGPARGEGSDRSTVQRPVGWHRANLARRLKNAHKSSSTVGPQNLERPDPNMPTQTLNEEEEEDRKDAPRKIAGELAANLSVPVCSRPHNHLPLASSSAGCRHRRQLGWTRLWGPMRMFARAASESSSSQWPTSSWLAKFQADLLSPLPTRVQCSRCSLRLLRGLLMSNRDTLSWLVGVAVTLLERQLSERTHWAPPMARPVPDQAAWTACN